MAPRPTKRKVPGEETPKAQEKTTSGVELFVDAPPDRSDDSGDETDSSASEDSVISGLEEEEDSGESEVESIDEGSESDDEAGESDDEAGESDDEDDDESGEDEDSGDDSTGEAQEEETVANKTKKDLSQVKKQVKTESITPVKKGKGKQLKKKENIQTTDSNDTAEEKTKPSNDSSPAKKNDQTKGTTPTKSLTPAKKGKGKQLKKKRDTQTTDPNGNDVSQGPSNDNDTPSSSTTQTAVTTPAFDEYEFDSSDEEDIRNTVGNIPMEWYREFEHIGYDLEGKKILKPKGGDQLDEFIDKMENPDYWRTVTDKTTGQKVVLSDKDVELIQRLRRGRYVDPTTDPYEPWEDFFTHEVMQHPVTNRPEDKRSFIPSKWERLKVGRIVHAMKMGWIKPKVVKTPEEEAAERFYNLWKSEDQSEISKRFKHHIPAPKLVLPGHAESYNPPPEYLLNEEEELAWKEQEPEDRRMNFIPQKYSQLRRVPAYSRFINERFERCLDLYLCPRVRRTRMNVDPEDLIPKLPKPKDLQPFPTIQSLIYKGHSDIVRTISVSPTGQWLASGSDDKTIKFWEVSTGRCMKTLDMGGVVKKLQWNPNNTYCLVAAAVENSVFIINPQLGDKLIQSNTDSIINTYEPPESTPESQNKLGVTWNTFEDLDYENGLRFKITHTKALSYVTWHARGDYFAVVVPDGGSQSVILHQLLKRRSQCPFSKSKGLVQCVLFHPTRPFLLMATQRYVRVYNLLKQELMKKLMTNCKWVSSMAIHPGGDNLIIGSYDCRLSWFDLDLSSKPYQTLRHHKKAIRSASYHSRYPLFASASDDGTVIVCHGMVFNDLLQNPMIVPVKVLRGHGQAKNLGVLDCTFHPTQPWLFSSGADGTVRLYT